MHAKMRKHYKQAIFPLKIHSWWSAILILSLLDFLPFTISLQQSNLSNLNLSSAEKLLLQSRLTSVQSQVEETYRHQILLESKSSTPSYKISRDLVLIFPGAGGPDTLTSELRDKIQTCDLDQDIKSALMEFCESESNSDKDKDKAECKYEDGRRSVIVYDWSSQRGSVLTAAFDGEAVGDALAQCLSRDLLRSNSKDLNDDTLFRSLHIIGISVGAFPAHQFVQTSHLLQLSSMIRLTFLDPFTSRGVAGVNYGTKYFGTLVQNVNVNVKFHAEHYLNTDDPVPSTNDPLPNCQPFVIDVTNVKEKESFVLPPGESNYHCWPVAFFANYGYEPSVRKDEYGNILWEVNAYD